MRLLPRRLPTLAVVLLLSLGSTAASAQATPPPPNIDPPARAGEPAPPPSTPSAASNAGGTQVTLLPSAERVEKYHGGLVPAGASLQKRDDPERRGWGTKLFWGGYLPQVVLGGVLGVAVLLAAFTNPVIALMGLFVVPLMFIPVLAPAIFAIAFFSGGLFAVPLGLVAAALGGIQVAGLYYWMTTKQTMLVYEAAPSGAFPPPAPTPGAPQGSLLRPLDRPVPLFAVAF